MRFGVHGVLTTLGCIVMDRHIGDSLLVITIPCLDGYVSHFLWKLETYVALVTFFMRCAHGGCFLT
jgi:hypothetical protein